MTIKYLKKAIKSPSTDDHETRASVQKILNDLEISREKGIKEISKKFDKYEGEVVVSKEKIEEASKKVNQKTKDDIKFAHERIKKFAEHQLKFETKKERGKSNAIAMPKTLRRGERARVCLSLRYDLPVCVCMRACVYMCACPCLQCRIACLVLICASAA